MQPLSKAKVKHFSSLKLKKYRKEQRLFLAEGIKLAEEALKSRWAAEAFIISEDFRHPITQQLPETNTYYLSAAEFAKISTHQHPEGIMCILRYPENLIHEGPLPDLCLLLDDIRDPGNLGTIIRTAAWFGFQEIICSEQSVDVFNPKVIRSTMGGIFHIPVKLHPDLRALVEADGAQFWAAHLEGQPVQQMDFPSKRVLLIGNESHGLSERMMESGCVRPVKIPGNSETESLNAAMAAGVLMWELVRGTRMGK